MATFYTYKTSYNTDHGDDSATLWPYRTTPLVLPGAKVKRDTANDCYLRHHPNPAMRAPVHSSFDHDVLMKQKVADSVLHRVAGDNVANKVVHKQFNSPIGLYSDASVADAIRHTTGSVTFKPTVVYDPAKSETFRALQEESYGGEIKEFAAPVQPKVFQPNKNVPFKKPHVPNQPQHSPQYHYVNSESNEIHQSGSFKRLMHHVLNENKF